MTVDKNTQEYYEKNASNYFSRTIGNDLTSVYTPFLQYIPQGGAILDAGCGVGRDSRYFASLGYEVMAFDPSPAMVARCRRYARVPVTIDSFQSFDTKEKFDGIWACASLLHVPFKGLPGTLQRLSMFLVPGGAIFANFRYGNGTHRDSEGRLFTDLDEDRAQNLLRAVEGLQLTELWSDRARNAAGTAVTWLNLIARRTPDA